MKKINKLKVFIYICPLLSIIIGASILLRNVTQSDATLLKGEKKLKKIIIDTDAGADDALAILLALKYESSHKDSLQVIAITCTYGNTEEENVETNVLKILTIANRSDIPVYGGAFTPLIKDWEDSHYFGNDGLGDFEFTEEITAKVNRSEIAAVALTDLVRRHPGEITIIALGPLTNIGLASQLDRKFFSSVYELNIVGSSVRGIGNIRPNVEFNIGTDPESSFIVFKSIHKPSILMPWEIVVESPITKEWRENVFGKLNSSTVKFLNKAEAVILGKLDSWSDIDPRMVAAILWPDLITKFIVTNVTPVFDGAAQGSVLVDYFNNTGKVHNAKIVQEFDLQLYKEKLLEYFAT